MPHAIVDEWQHIKVKQIGGTFVCEIEGVDFSKPIPAEVFNEISLALARYGVCVFRRANMTDDTQVSFSGMFGDLDNAAPWVPPGTKYRLKHLELFDVSNLEADGSLVQLGSKRHHISMVNSKFHCDFAYNPRRAGLSSLRGVALPPRGNGGNTEFADSRTAYEEFPEDVKQLLEENDFIGANSLVWSRMKAGPKDSPWLQNLNPETNDFGRHALVQTHERSGRKNLYISVHTHHLEYRTPRSRDFVPTPEQPFERVPEAEGKAIIERLLQLIEEPKYVCSVEWENENDLILWDNTCVMHRTGKGTFAGKYFRDMRRCTVLDGSSTAWGYNPRFKVNQKAVYHPDVDRWIHVKE